jgi:hypothetical protein
MYAGELRGVMFDATVNDGMACEVYGGCEGVDPFGV